MGRLRRGIGGTSGRDGRDGARSVPRPGAATTPYRPRESFRRTSSRWAANAATASAGHPTHPASDTHRGGGSPTSRSNPTSADRPPSPPTRTRTAHQPGSGRSSTAATSSLFVAASAEAGCSTTGPGRSRGSARTRTRAAGSGRPVAASWTSTLTSTGPARGGVGAVNTALSAYYYLKVVRVMVLDDPADPDPVRTPPAAVAYLAILAAALFALGVAWDPLTRAAATAAGAFR